jgi:hypothetical protein
VPLSFFKRVKAKQDFARLFESFFFFFFFFFVCVFRPIDQYPGRAALLLDVLYACLEC